MKSSIWILVLLAGLHQVKPETTTESPEERKVTIPPLIVEEPEKLIPFRVEESIEVVCVATGEPEPVYKWKMDGKDFDPSGNDGRIAIQPGVGTLIFARPLERDQGMYQCLAENQVGTALTVIIDLRQAYLEPFQTSGTREYRPNIGESLTLSCIPPLSYPDPDIFWATISDDERFIPIDLTDRVTMDPRGYLHFVNIEAEDYQDGRTYACIVQNQVMRSTQQGEYARVIPQGDAETLYPPDVLWADPTHQVALRGNTWRVKCIFSGKPTTKVDWTRIDGGMPEGRWRQESYGQELVIENVQFEDAGNYECQGINEYVSVPIRKSFILELDAAPYWIQRPISIDGAEGDMAVFTCECGAIPEPVNFWFINGIPTSTLPEDSNRIVEAKTMTFLNLTKEDAQVIQCNSTNKHGYEYANAYLNVLTEPPIILDPPLEGQKAAETQTIELICNVFGSPKPLVVWRKGSEQLTGGRYSVMDNGNLQIVDVMLVDAGTYQCTATNSLDTVSASGSLIVRRRTEIQTPPEDVMVEEKTEAKITCTATTDPEEVKNLEINWMKDDQFIDYALAQRVFRNDMDNSLTISGTMSLDTGKYTCVASNGIDEDQAAADLMVQAPPDAPDDVTVVCGTESSGTLGEKEAEIEWMPGRENYAPILNFIVQFNTSSAPDTWYEITSNISQNTRKIVVELAPYENYTFRVLARNKIGISDPSQPSTSYCNLLDKQETPPKNPDNVVGEGDEPDNLIIFWTPMSRLEYYGPGFKYIVTYKQMNIPDPIEHKTEVTDLEKWYYEVYGQPTYQPYEITVRANNNEGDSEEPVVVVVGYSGEAEPMAAPSNVYVEQESVSSTEVVMSWDQVDLSPESVRGYFRGYRVQFATEEDWPDNVRETDFIFNQSYQYPRPRHRVQRQVDVVTVTLTHLPSNTDLRATVRVLNKYYAGPPSAEVSFTTLPGVPGPPAMFDVTSRGPTHFDMIWAAPYEPNGELTGYQVYYQTVIGLNLGRMQYREPMYEPDMTGFRLTGLSPMTYYRVYLSALTAQGMGEPIFLDMQTIEPGPPAAPTATISGMNETWINVSWIPAQTENPGYVFYVQYRYRGAYQWRTSPDEYINMWVELVDMEPGTVYQIRVVAKNGEDQEAPAEWLEVQTQGQPLFNFQLATSGWFYGIWVALVMVVVFLVLFFVVKKYTDENFLRKESKIESNVREMQAEEFGKQMDLLNDYVHEYMDDSTAMNGYDDGDATFDDPAADPNYYMADPYAGAHTGTTSPAFRTYQDEPEPEPAPSYHSGSFDRNSQAGPSAFNAYKPPEAKTTKAPGVQSAYNNGKKKPPSPLSGAMQSLRNNGNGKGNSAYKVNTSDEPLPPAPVRTNKVPSRAGSMDNISVRSSQFGDTSFVLQKAKGGQPSDTFV